MALNKAIHYGKEKRTEYRKAKAHDRSCRNHGTCEYCKSNRTIKNQKLAAKAKELMEVK